MQSSATDGLTLLTNSIPLSGGCGTPTGKVKRPRPDGWSEPVLLALSSPIALSPGMREDLCIVAQTRLWAGIFGHRPSEPSVNRGLLPWRPPLNLLSGRPPPREN
jgi:hypothetical protein